MILFLLLLALLGHVFLWIEVVNRIHAEGVPYRLGRAISLMWLACMAAVPAALVWWLLASGIDLLDQFRPGQFPAAVLVYLLMCHLAAGVAVVRWVRRAVFHRPPDVLRYHRTRRVELAQDSDTVTSQQHAHHFLVHLPGNEILELDVTQRAIDVPRLPGGLDALSIVHMSDFHFTGRVGKSFFREVVRRSNEMQPDLVAITGDIVDYPDCIDWIPDTLGKLTAGHGVYFVLGNHDIRVDADRLRQTLIDSGLVDLGGRWVQVAVRGAPVVLAGNELPWIAPAADMRRCPKRTPGGGPLRIVLSHSPDQLEWAQVQDADLLLAGHTHGGQIRLPLIGAIVSATRLGVGYASGIFYAPPTILHVTRGVSGELPVRLNCPPEMAHLVLRSRYRQVAVDGRPARDKMHDSSGNQEG